MREKLYAFQENYGEAEWARRIENGEAETWMAMDNADSWGNRLPLEPVEPFFKALPRQTIVTLGDGKGGKDARFFKDLGHEVTATDLIMPLLAEAQKRGYVDHVSKENAEALSFGDGAFDWAVAKEALHHMQRPYLALYEMLRVSKKGILLIEPHNQQNYLRIKGVLSYLWKRLTGKQTERELGQTPLVSYEESGNYAYKFHPYELSQCALAQGFLHVAYTYAYYFYEKNYPQIRGEELQKLQTELRRKMAERDQQGGLEARPLLVFFIFKEPPTTEATDVLRRSGFRIPVFPRNPYV